MRQQRHPWLLHLAYTTRFQRNIGFRLRERSCRLYHELSYQTTNQDDPLSVLNYSRKDDGIPSFPYPSSSIVGTRKTNTNNVAVNDDWMLVEMHAAPWNPADLNTVQGRYPAPRHTLQHLRHSQTQSHPESPPMIVAGSEGLGRIVEVIPSSSSSWTSSSKTELRLQQEPLQESPVLTVGDWVVLGLPGLGSYRSHIWLPRRALLKLKYCDHLLSLSSSQSMYYYPNGRNASTVATASRRTTTPTQDIASDNSKINLRHDHIDDKFQLSTLLQLGGTAYRMLLDYHAHDQSFSSTTTQTIAMNGSEHCQPIAVIQNAALSNVGYMVQQILPSIAETLCSPSSTNANSSHPYHHAPRTTPPPLITCLINVVRSTDVRPSMDSHRRGLSTETSSFQRHGVFYITEDELANCRNSRDLWELIITHQQQSQPSATNADTSPHCFSQRPPLVLLALDAVGGQCGSQLVRVLDVGGTCVNYGALSQQALTVAAPQLIFQSKTLTGHWHSDWMQRSPLTWKQNLLDTLV